jgi:hypothetical protein
VEHKGGISNLFVFQLARARIMAHYASISTITMGSMRCGLCGAVIALLGTVSHLDDQPEVQIISFMLCAPCCNKTTAVAPFALHNNATDLVTGACLLEELVHEPRRRV